MRRGMRMHSEEEPDESLDPALGAAAAAYNEPPGTVPREAMWQRIQATRAPGVAGIAREARRTELPSSRVWGHRWWWRRTPMAAAAAALLVAVGISIGWWVRGTRPEAVVVAPPAAPAGAVADASRPADRIAVTRDLTQAEALLTAFRDGSRSSDADAQLAAWARDVLSNTQLLLDSPVAADPQRRQLLKDLELVLVQMTQSVPSYTPTDREMIDRTLDRDHVLPRIRAAVPAGNAGT